MDYRRHKQGLMIAILSHDCPAQAAFDYCKEHNIANWREAERQIIKNHLVATRYVRELKKKRWPELERQLRDKIDVYKDGTMERIMAVIHQGLYWDATDESKFIRLEAVFPDAD